MRIYGSTLGAFLLFFVILIEAFIQDCENAFYRKARKEIRKVRGEITLCALCAFFASIAFLFLTIILYGEMHFNAKPAKRSAKFAEG